MIRTADAELGELGRLIKAWANAQRFPPTQAAIASEVGVSPQSISNWMRGNFVRPMQPRHLAALAKMMSDVSKPVEEARLEALEAMLRDTGFLPKGRLGDPGSGSVRRAR